MYGILQVSQKYGMQTLNMSLYDLVMTKQISPERALMVANVPEELQRMMGGAVSTTIQPQRHSVQPR